MNLSICNCSITQVICVNINYVVNIQAKFNKFNEIDYLKEIKIKLFYCIILVLNNILNYILLQLLII